MIQGSHNLNVSRLREPTLINQANCFLSSEDTSPESKNPWDTIEFVGSVEFGTPSNPHISTRYPFTDSRLRSLVKSTTTVHVNVLGVLYVVEDSVPCNRRRNHNHSSNNDSCSACNERSECNGCSDDSDCSSSSTVNEKLSQTGTSAARRQLIQSERVVQSKKEKKG